LRLQKIAPEVADASKAPSAKLEMLDMCHPMEQWKRVTLTFAGLANKCRFVMTP
jgi:hypothetical protein